MNLMDDNISYEKQDNPRKSNPVYALGHHQIHSHNYYQGTAFPLLC